MQKRVVKEVLEEIVKIDTEAEVLKNKNKSYVTNSDEQLKQEIHQHELELMQEVRAKVKTELQARSESLTQQKLDIKAASDDYIESVMDYYHRYKSELIEQLFREIFIGADNG